MIAVTVDDHGTVKKLEQLYRQARNPRQMMLACGREVGNQLKSHYRTRDRYQSNKLGGQREHFWLQVANSVQSPVVDTSGLVVTVSINDPRIAQKIFGGVIRAKRVDALTIPQTPEAYGRSASTFERETGLKLFLVKRDGKGVGLGVTAAGGGVTVEYILTPSVYQDPDPDALPRMELLAAVVELRAQTEVDRQVRDAGLK